MATYDGSSWSAPARVAATYDVDASVSCASEQACVVVNSAGRAIRYVGHAQWGEPMNVDGGFTLDCVSCTSETFCIAISFNGPSAFAGSSWSPIQIFGSGMRHISCPTTTLCQATAVGGGGYVYDGSGWSQVGAIIPQSGGLTSISCPSSAFCSAVDRTGNAVLYDGTGWSPPDKVDPNVPQYTSLDDVSSPSKTFCVAVDSAGQALTYHPSGWSTPELGAIGTTGIGCDHRVPSYV